MKPVVLLMFVLSLVCAAMAHAASSDLQMEALSNLSYPLKDAPNGKVPLKGGRFTAPLKDSAARFEARLLTPIALSSWRGKEVAAVVLSYSSGGSGVFQRLFFLTKDEKAWRPKAWTCLGDRVQIRYLGLEHHGKIVVGMINQGPKDPLCCPTQKQVRVYIVKGKKLLPQKTVPTQIFPDQIHFARNISSGDIKAILVPEQGFSAHGITKVAPYPSHVALMIDGKIWLRILPAEAYKNMWMKKNDFTIQIAIKRIERIIQGKETDFTPPLPILPPQPGINDLAARVELIDLAQGRGIGFIGRISKTFSCVKPGDLKYFFSGLTNKERFVLSFSHEISIKKLPQGTWSCENSISGLRSQIAKVTELLKSADDNRFRPRISMLKKFLASISIEDGK